MSPLKKKFTAFAELQEEVSDCHLEVEGKIPSWLSGTLVRNGPVYVAVDGKINSHWFDGLAMLHAFSFKNGQVSYSNKFLKTDAYQAVFEKGSLNYMGFATDPCRSLFKHFFSFLLPVDTSQLHNANINVAKIADKYVALTEIPLPVSFDPQTLETLGVLDYQDGLPHDKCWESAHPHYDSKRRETWNYLVQYGRQSKYIAYRLKDGSSTREIVASIPVDEPSYMHSFAITENYVVFTEFPFVVKPLDFVIKNQPFINNFFWQPERGTQFTVVKRASGELIGRYKTNPFFAFHHINAFEKDGQICLDIVSYDDPGVIKEVAAYFNPCKKRNPLSIQTSLMRFVLTLETGDLRAESVFQPTAEFPRINGNYDGLPYKYVYLSDPREPEEGASRCLYKVHMDSKEALSWQEAGCCPGEPVFVASPDGINEDEGVVLTVVLDARQGSSFLLVLDGKSFEEIGRTKIVHTIPPGLHGQYFSEARMKNG